MEEQTLGLTQVLAVNLTQPFNKERAGHLMCAESSEELLNVLNHNMQKEINDSNVDFSPGPGLLPGVESQPICILKKRSQPLVV